MSAAGSVVLRVSHRRTVDDLLRRLDGLPATGWSETVPYPADDYRAARLRARLAGQRLGVARVRVTVLSYADGVREVVVTADPRFLGQGGMCALAVDAPGRITQPEPGLSPGLSPETAVPWALDVEPGPPRTGSARVPVVLDADPERAAATVLAAAAAAVTRRTGDAVTVVLHRATAAEDGVLGPDHAEWLRLPGGAAADAPAGGVPELEFHPPLPASMRPVLRVTPAPQGLLSLALDRDAAGWTLRCDYPAHRLGRETVGVLLTEIAVGLAPASPARAPSAPAGDPCPADRPATIHALVARHAAARPGAVAVTCGPERLTYGELGDWSATVAAALRARGAGPGTLVGVCLPRGPALIAALLGVLRCGAAYVPLDGAYPPERLRLLARDADLGVVLTDRDDPELFGCPTLAPPPRPADSAAAAETDAGAATDPAYVIYTSGSTGRPKGVVVEHRNVARLLAATAGEFGLSPGDVWTCFHSVAFDFSVWEIWACLTTGGRLVVVTDDVIRDPDRFRELLHREQVSVLNQTPSAFAQLLSTERAGALPLAVRLLIFGGEPLDARILLPWFDALPERRCRVVNMYGITETTVHTTMTTLTRRDALAGSRSVGRALPGWRVHVLDPYGRPVPAGVPGEIHVGGAGVARGYLGRAGLTAQRFRPDHLTPGSTARLYRSGDLGRLRPDGRLEHLGRLDGQVKIRGYRIELGEIRQHLVELPGVRAAAIVHRRRGRDGDGHLDAYVVGPAADAAALRERLRGALPAHLVPSTVTVLDELPTTGNGKLDVARLPDPAVVPPAGPPPAPVGDLLGRMSLVWHEVLGSPVAPDDNFFLSGGNSLLAIRIVVGLRERGIADVPVRLLYRHPTVRGLAGALGTIPDHAATLTTSRS